METKLMTPRELVLAQFPGRLYLPLVEAGVAMGMAPKTAYNLHALGKFPVRVTYLGLTGKRPVVAIHDLIVHLEGGQPIIYEAKEVETPALSLAPAPVLEKRRGPGRPTKREAKERAARLASLSS